MVIDVKLRVMRGEIGMALYRDEAPYEKRNIMYPNSMLRSGPFTSVKAVSCTKINLSFSKTRRLNFGSSCPCLQ